MRAAANYRESTPSALIKLHHQAEGRGLNTICLFRNNYIVIMLLRLPSDNQSIANCTVMNQPAIPVLRLGEATLLQMYTSNN